jgi:hypothetical protein
MKIGTADRATRHFNDRVTRLFDLGGGDGVAPDVFLAVLACLNSPDLFLALHQDCVPQRDGPSRSLATARRCASAEIRSRSGRRAGRFQNGELVRLPFKQQRADAPWIAARAFQCALAAIVSVSRGAYGLEQEVSRSDPFCLLRTLRSAILSFADQASSRSKSRSARLVQERKFRVTYDSN